MEMPAKSSTMPRIMLATPKIRRTYLPLRGLLGLICSDMRKISPNRIYGSADHSTIISIMRTVWLMILLGLVFRNIG